MKKSEETKGKILDTTIEMISEKGYASTTTKEIAEDAGVSEGTIFKYYDSKQELLRSIVERTIEEFLEYSVNEAIPEAFSEVEEEAPQRVLKRLLKERTKFFQEHKFAFHVIIQEMMVDETIRDTFRKEIWSEMKTVSDRIFDRAKRMGRFKHLDNRTLRRVIFGTFFFQIIFEGMLEVNEGRSGPTEEEVETTLDVLFSGILSERSNT